MGSLVIFLIGSLACAVANVCLVSRNLASHDY